MNNTKKKKVNENNDLKENHSKEFNEKKEKELKKSYLKTLVILIIALVIVDSISLIYYYKPNISFNFGSNSNKSNNSNNIVVKDSKCEDGTLFDSCSNNKPFYCYQGQLLKKAATCGCPEGYKIAFQDCKII